MTDGAQIAPYIETVLEKRGPAFPAPRAKKGVVHAGVDAHLERFAESETSGHQLIREERQP
jgi:hypothetical protein